MQYNITQKKSGKKSGRNLEEIWKKKSVKKINLATLIDFLYGNYISVKNSLFTAGTKS
jgi:hypothetical protein